MPSTLNTQNGNLEPVNYSDEERKHRAALIKKLTNMRFERERPHNELDGQTYTQYYETNRKKDLSYIPPKQNKSDIRVTTGTTREKDNTIKSLLLNMNTEPDVTAFDTDNLAVHELGDNITDMVMKSREIEEWAKKKPIVYHEMIAQGDVFIQEIFTEKFQKVPLEKLNWDPLKDGVSGFSFKERLKKVHAQCETRMISGLKVLLGTLRGEGYEYIENQDMVAIANVRNRDEMEQIYGQWERWKNVPKTIDTLEFENESSIYRQDWNVVQIDNQDKVGEIFIFDKANNRYMIMLNGVMMLPINYPLTAIDPTGEIPMAQGKFEPISGFAYSKSQPTKTKVDQSVIDEVTRVMVRKFRQGAEPPSGSKGKKVYSKSIFDPGRINTDMKDGDIFPLIDQPGITPADFNFYNLIKDSINEKTANDVVAGSEVQGDPTATQINTQKEQQMMKLGSAMDAVVNLEQRLTWLRINNILIHWTNPVDTRIDETRDNMRNIFNQFSVNTTLEDGQSGTKIFRLTEEAFPDIRQQEQEEEDESRKRNMPVRIVYMDPHVLKSMRYRWFVVIRPTPESNDALSQLLFVQNIRQAAELFGIESLNLEYLKQRYATVINEDYNKMFKQLNMREYLQMNQEQEGAATAGGGGGNAPRKKATQNNAKSNSGPMRAQTSVS